MHKLRAFRLFFWIKTEDDGDSFAPVGTFSFRVEQSDIACKMFFVVGADAIQLRRLVLKG